MSSTKSNKYFSRVQNFKAISPTSPSCYQGHPSASSPSPWSSTAIRHWRDGLSPHRSVLHAPGKEFTGGPINWYILKCVAGRYQCLPFLHVVNPPLHAFSSNLLAIYSYLHLLTPAGSPNTTSWLTQYSLSVTWLHTGQRLHAAWHCH